LSLDEIIGVFACFASKRKQQESSAIWKKKERKLTEIWKKRNPKTNRSKFGAFCEALKIR
jgi:hypothetical protein